MPGTGIRISKSQGIVFATLYLSYIGVYICRKNYGNLVSSFTTIPPDSCQSSNATTSSFTNYNTCKAISPYCVFTASSNDSLQGTCTLPDVDTLFVGSDERLSLEQVGRLGTAFQLAAAASKFITPIFVDTHSPRLVLSGALLICALTNIAMSFFTSNLAALTFLWGLNGFINALAWPALSKAFMLWFPNPEQRGRLYSFMSTNQSIGAALAPVIVLYGTSILGTWKAVMIAPGIVGIVVAVLVYLFVQDKEEQDGKGGKEGKGVQKDIQNKNKNKKKNTKKSTFKETNKETMSSLLWDEVFTNPAVYMLGVCHMCTLLVRDGWSDLSIKYLTDKETWSYTQESTTQCVWMLHVGGFIGSLAAGWISDKIYNGKRAPVIGLAMGSCIFPLMLLMRGPSGYPSSLVSYVPLFSFLLLGCFSFTPHVLLGLMARELVPTKAQTTAASMEKFMANLGGAMAGSPLGYVVQTYGWNGGLKVFMTASVIGLSAMVPLWNRSAWKAFDEKVEVEEIKSSISTSTESKPKVGKKKKKRARSKKR